MILAKDKIHLILPQQEPFIMIDTLLQHNETSTTTQLTIADNNIMVSNGLFSAAGHLENLAQTAAAYLGYTAFLKGLPAPLGFIASVKNYSIFEHAKVNDTVVSKIEYQSAILNIHIVNATCTCNGKLLNQAELRIFIQE